jgi:sigma-B regulation protein RsbU (phosphoserine phosphatase)
METDLYQRIQTGINKKRQNLTKFLETAPETEKEICLCDEEPEVLEHLHVIESSLEMIGTQTFGVCKICHGYIEANRLEMDYTASVCLDHFSPADRRRLEAELELSQIVQRALLPQQLPEINGVEVAAFSRPSEIIGGDYFDFFRFKDGSEGIIIADVSGHGMSAGMLMSSLQTALRTMAPDTDSPAEILERINRFYIHNINFTTFVTIFLARFDPATRVLHYVNAGHNPPDLFRKQSGDIKWLMPTSAAIGLMEDFHPRTDSVELSEGDMLLLYTDGLTEASNPHGEMFGEDRLNELILQNVGRPVSEMIQVVRQRMTAFIGDQKLQDDITIVALKMLN